MADFQQAYELTIKHEGGWVNDPDDKGGETYRGIARNYHPTWEGWEIIDQIQEKEKGDVFPEADKQTGDFYRRFYWDRILGDKINSQDVANQVFDWTVNSGSAKKQIQKLINNQFGKCLVVDGVFGPKTVEAINYCVPIWLSNAIVNQRVAYYATGVAEGWLHAKFLKGLVLRAKQYQVSND